MSKVHCDGWLYCERENADAVKKTLVTHGVKPDEIIIASDCVLFGTMYFKQDDAEEVVDQLKNKLDDFEFDFDDYTFDERSRYTKKRGVEKEKRIYVSDIVDRLLNAGYSPQETSKIIAFIA